MAFYRKKPVVIEARRFTPSNADYEAAAALAAWCGGKLIDGDPIWEPKIEIPTMEGVMTVSAGDWIICGLLGEFYPCKPHIFEATYEFVGS